MRILFSSAAVAALAWLSAGLPSAAQGQAVGSSDVQGSTERSADQMTCRDLNVVEAAAVPGLLYFIAGHRAGMEEVAALHDMEAARHRLGDAGMGGEAPAQGAPEPGGSVDGAAAAEGGSGGSVAGPAGDDDAVTVRGHFPIPIERAVIACAETPDALVGDVIVQERQAVEAESAAAGGGQGG